ncbi:MAG: hypothetical protein H7A41_01185 [Chlamydiales bacterium]|nr:hypothetical protein [Chlamydiales bacterium]
MKQQFFQKAKELLVFFAITFTLFSSQILADQFTLLGIIGEGGVPLTSTLVAIDQNTGGVDEVIGTVGYRVNGLAYDPTTGNLYASTSVHDPLAPNSLIIIDQQTGAGTVIGSFSLPLGISTLNNLTCDSTGQLYGLLVGPAIADHALTQVNKSDAAITPFPPASLDFKESSLDFNASDILYLFQINANIYTLSTVTGQPTLVGPYARSTADHHGKFNPATQQFWSISEPQNSPVRDLNIFDVPSGTLAFSFPTVDDLHTLAFVYNFPPHSLTGVQKRNKFLTETEYYNELRFHLVDPVEASAFHIYRNGKRIATIPSTAKKYIDHNQKRKKPVEYSVEVVFTDGSISNPQSVVVQ